MTARCSSPSSCSSPTARCAPASPSSWPAGASPRSCDAAGAGERADAVRLPGRLLVPGFVNAHSHAFQRAPARPRRGATPAAPDDDFWTWREAMYAAAGALDPRGDPARSARPASRGPARRATRRSASSTTSTTGPTARRTRSRTRSRWPSSRPRARPASASCCCWPPTRAAARAGRRARASGASATRSVEAYLARVEASRDAGRGRPAGHRRLRAALGARRAARLARGDRGARGRARASRARARRRAAARDRGVARRARPAPDRAARRLRRCSATAPPSSTRPTLADAELDLLAERGATVCACPTTEANLGDGFLPAARCGPRGVPVAFGSDSNMRLDPFEEVRETEGWPAARRPAQRARAPRRRGPGAVALGVPVGSRRARLGLAAAGSRRARPPT